MKQQKKSNSKVTIGLDLGIGGTGFVCWMVQEEVLATKFHPQPATRFARSTRARSHKL